MPLLLICLWAVGIYVMSTAHEAASCGHAKRCDGECCDRWGNWRLSDLLVEGALHEASRERLRTREVPWAPVDEQRWGPI